MAGFILMDGTPIRLGAFGAGMRQAAVDVERRLFEHLWITGGVGIAAGLDLGRDTYTDGTVDTSSRQALGVRGRLGLRPVLNPGAPIVLSGLALVEVGGDVDSSTWDDQVGNADGSIGIILDGVSRGTVSAAAMLGVAAEHWLTPSLGVRLSTSIADVRLGYGTATLRPDPIRKVTGGFITGGVGLAPGLGVHLRF